MAGYMRLCRSDGGDLVVTVVVSAARCRISNSISREAGPATPCTWNDTENFSSCSRGVCDKSSEIALQGLFGLTGEGMSMC